MLCESFYVTGESEYFALYVFFIYFIYNLPESASILAVNLKQKKQDQMWRARGFVKINKS